MNVDILYVVDNYLYITGALPFSLKFTHFSTVDVSGSRDIIIGDTFKFNTETFTLMPYLQGGVFLVSS